MNKVTGDLGSMSMEQRQKIEDAEIAEALLFAAHRREDEEYALMLRKKPDETPVRRPAQLRLVK